MTSNEKTDEQESTHVAFPLDVFPTWLKGYAHAVEQECEVSPDAVGALCVGALAHVCQGRFAAQIDGGWTQELCLYVTVSAEPGERKSAVHSRIFKPLRLFASAYRKANAATYHDALSIQRSATKALEKAEEACAQKPDKEELQAARRSAVSALVACRPPTRLPAFVDDITTESAAREMATSHGITTFALPEGDGFIKRISGLYSKGSAGPLDLFLKSMDGEEVTVNRVGSSELNLPRPLMTIVIMMQPHILDGLTRGDIRGTGLLARFNMSLPESMLGKRTHEARPVPTELATTYAENMKALAMAPLSDTSHAIPFSSEAREELKAYSVKLESLFKGAHATIPDWASKSSGVAARVATLLALADGVANGVAEAPVRVGPKHVENGVRVAEHFLTQALRVAARLNGGSGAKRQNIMLSRLKASVQTRGKDFTQRDGMRALKGMTAKEFQLGMADLVALGDIVQGSGGMFSWPAEPAPKSTSTLGSVDSVDSAPKSDIGQQNNRGSAVNESVDKPLTALTVATENDGEALQSSTFVNAVNQLSTNSLTHHGQQITIPNAPKGVLSTLSTPSKVDGTLGASPATRQQDVPDPRQPGLFDHSHAADGDIRTVEPGNTAHGSRAVTLSGVPYPTANDFMPGPVST